MILTQRSKLMVFFVESPGTIVNFPLETLIKEAKLLKTFDKNQFKQDLITFSDFQSSDS